MPRNTACPDSCHGLGPPVPQRVAILTSTEVLAVHGGRHVTGVRIRDTHHAGESTIAVAAAFVAVGQAPCSDLLVGLVDLAAGDLIDYRYRQAVTAAASGCAAALDVQR
jgi:thioredoxin reductase (NADPH)